MLLSNAAIKNRTTVLVLILLIVAAGAYSYVTLPREAAPDVPIPVVLVTTIYKETSPEDVESLVTIKIENELKGIKGVKEITSISAEGQSVITIEFQPEIRIEDALQYVRDKVDVAKGELPLDAEEPTIREINIAELPIMMVNISGNVSPAVLKGIADRLEEEIEQIPGVLEVDVLGAAEREIRLEIDPYRVQAYGLTIPELVKLIPSENVNVSAGGLETPGTRFNVRVPAQFVKPDEVDNLPLTTRGGKTIYLTDVAKVTDTFKDRTSFARLDGAESVTLSVRKTVGANIQKVGYGVKAVVAAFREQLPPSIRIELTLDQSKDVDMMISDLENGVISGLILVVLVLVAFMGWRTSAIVALAIPMSMLISFALLDALGYTLNMVVLFSLILALGMLVDNAIVIVENIFRHRQLGLGQIEASMAGAGEVAWPVITSTATTVGAFAPLLFWPGIMGEFMKFLPITLIITLTSSLFVALVISPTVCSVLSGHVRQVKARHPFIEGYRRLLGTALKHWPATLSLAVLIMAGVVILYGKRGRGVELFPIADPRRATINIRGPQGMNIHKSNRLAQRVENRVKKFRPDDLEHVVANVGSGGGGISLSGQASGPHVSNLTLLFHDFEDRPRPSVEAAAEIRKLLGGIAGAEVKLDKERHGPPTGAPIAVRIIGDDFKTLRKLSERAKRLISDVPIRGLVNLRSDLELTRPELAFIPNRLRGMLLGVSPAVSGEYLKTCILGRKVGTYREFNDEYDITVRLPERHRSEIQHLFHLCVPSDAGQAVSLRSLGDFQYRGGFGTINRVDQKRVVTLTADAEGRLDTEVLKDVQERLSPLGQSRLLSADVLDWGGFCRALRDAGKQTDPSPARRIWRLLKPGGLLGFTKKNPQKLIERLAGGETAEPEARAEVLAAVNQVVKRADLYRAEDFKGIELTDEAKAYIERDRKDLSDKEVQRLNRLLLEATFPGVLAKRELLELPEGYRIAYAGQKEFQEDAEAFLGKAFGFALLLIILILVAQFNTISAPFIIMFTVVLSMIGVLTGLLICRRPFGIVMTGVGVIGLAGVVVNNAIVLLDYARRLQRQGLDVIAAAIQAGATRLRPVMLTATTTILGLLPMATGVNLNFRKFSLGNPLAIISTRSETSQFWSSMAIAVIFGLAVATVLTLVVVPTLYVTLYRASAHFGLGGLKKREAESEAAGHVEPTPAP